MLASAPVPIESPGVGTDGSPLASDQLGRMLSSVRLKRTLTSMVVATLLLLWGLVNWGISRSFDWYAPRIRHDLQHEAQRGARELAQAAQLAKLTRDPRALAAVSGAYVQDPDVVWLAVLDPRGSPLFEYGKRDAAVAGLFERAAGAAHDLGSMYAAWVPAHIQGFDVGRAVLLVSKARLEMAAQRRRETQAAAACACLLLLALWLSFVQLYLGPKLHAAAELHAGLERAVEAAQHSAQPKSQLPANMNDVSLPAADKHAPRTAGLELQRVLIVVADEAQRAELCELAAGWGMRCAATHSAEHACALIMDSQAQAQAFEVAVIDGCFQESEPAGGVLSDLCVAEALPSIRLLSTEPTSRERDASTRQLWLLKPLRASELYTTLISLLCGASHAQQPAAPSKWGLDPEVARSVRLIDLFLRAAPKQLAELELAVQARELERVKQLAHKFKGSCRSLGAGQLAESAHAVERAAIQGETDESAMAELAAGLAVVCALLQQSRGGTRAVGLGG
jgi:HPt (histidine-containing phosphotransfer) domain-containing protein